MPLTWTWNTSPARTRAGETCTMLRYAVLMDLFGDMRPRAADRLRVSAIDPALVMGSADQLKQLLLIVLDNALRYTPAPGLIRATLRRERSEAVVTVDDEGIGVPAEVATHAFERFYRGDDARRLEPDGRGLGLAIAQWIATRHGGTISLVPRAPRGTSVVVRLPLAA